ncbi:peptidoglycan-recognition protein SB1-like [Phymastichus coffea]|uniref:peptidoglycan-recognition protein SB1-like n=1 Tax=Phymastichus coffea TaxID=108790 RepID=UPI00273C79EF|nr:peptidoglycan-recognition protein SB1-like [Phymastichus coffea]
MFETDTALLTSTGKYSLPTWKKVGVCFVLIICFVSLYVTLSKLDFEKKLITQSFYDQRSVEIVTVIPRQKWISHPAVKQVLITQPASYIIISHTDTDTCYTQDQCYNQILEHTLMSESYKSRFNDLGYNFLIGNNQIYEHRGWGVQPHNYYNYKDNNCISIALIGNFSEIRPVDSQLENLQKLIQYGIEKGKIHKNYILLGLKQFRNTNSPGQVLFKIIQKWDHWSEIPQNY